MPRNFGLGHLNNRATFLPRKLPASFGSRLLYSCERLLQCAPYSLSKGERPSGQRISVVVEYMGRNLFVHEPDQSTYTVQKPSLNGGKSCA